MSLHIYTMACPLLNPTVLRLILPNDEEHCYGCLKA